MTTLVLGIKEFNKYFGGNVVENGGDFLGECGKIWGRMGGIWEIPLVNAPKFPGFSFEGSRPECPLGNFSLHLQKLGHKMTYVDCS